jgi:hypothetical protein
MRGQSLCGALRRSGLSCSNITKCVRRVQFGVNRFTVRAVHNAALGRSTHPPLTPLPVPGQGAFLPV